VVAGDRLHDSGETVLGHCGGGVLGRDALSLERSNFLPIGGYFRTPRKECARSTQTSRLLLLIALVRAEDSIALDVVDEVRSEECID